MTITKLLSVVVTLVACHASVLLAQGQPRSARLEDFLSNGRKAATPTSRPSTRPAIAKATAPAPEPSAKPSAKLSDVNALRDTLEGNVDELFESGNVLYSEALAELTTGPEMAALQTEETHLRRKIAQLELRCGDVKDTIEKERRALQDSIAGIARIYKTGTPEFKAEVAKLVERRKPRLELFINTAANYPPTADALKDRLAKVATDREYLQFAAADLRKPSDSVAAMILASAASAVTGTATTRPAADIENDYQQAAKWLTQVGVSQDGTSPAPTNQLPALTHEDAAAKAPPAKDQEIR